MADWSAGKYMGAIIGGGPGGGKYSRLVNPCGWWGGAIGAPCWCAPGGPPAVGGGIEAAAAAAAAAMDPAGM